MSLLYILIFIASCWFLYLAGGLVVKGLMTIAKFLGWREFVVAFFTMAFASSLPNFFIGITSALRKISELSFGDVAGNNLAALSLGVGLAIFFSRREIPAESRTVQRTSVFTMIAAILPLVLLWDGELSRIDGGLLIALFIYYLAWLFSKRERFTRVYDTERISFKDFIKNLGWVIVGIGLFAGAAQGIVVSAQFFAENLKVSLVLIGILITGLGGAIPEIHFAITSAKRGETWMILGDIMGAVIVPATFVLGIVALIYPIKISDFSPLIIARLFLILSALSFFFFTRTDRKITKKEATFLVGIYLVFVIVEILSKL